MPYISNFERESEARGMAICEARGREAGTFGLVVKLLNRRVGKIYEETLVTVRALSIASLAPKAIKQLEQLGEDLMGFTGSSDLTEWLKRFNVS